MVGEVAADVPQAGRAQQGVGDGVADGAADALVGTAVLGGPFRRDLAGEEG